MAEDTSAQLYSPYRRFTLDAWAELRRRTPLSLTEQELDRLRGINVQMSIDEVVKVYLPLSRLLSFHVASTQQLNLGVREYMGVESGKVPFIIGIAGSVAVGKSTVARVLQTLLARWPEHPRVDLVTTDGFLLPTRELQRRDLMQRKGFPESYDKRALLRFLADVKGGRGGLRAPVYSHRRYDILPGEYVLVDQPDILIVEGLNVLQAEPALAGEVQPFISDYFDFSLYIDAEESRIRQWYIERFMTLRQTVFNQSDAYFSHYADLDDEAAKATATEIWTTINRANLLENILPTRQRATLILHKCADHRVDEVLLRKL